MKISIKNVLCFCLALSLTACGIYGHYERPELEQVDSLYREGTAMDSSMAVLSWKTVFTDTLLQSLIQKGIDQNTDLNIARLHVEEAEARLSASKAAYAPSLVLNPQGQISSFNENPTAVKTYDLGIAANWEVDLFGKVTNEKRQAQASWKESEAYRQAVMTRLIANIASSYYQLLMLDRQLEISQKTLVSWDKTIQAMEALKKAGLSNEAAVLQAKANRLNLDGSILNLKKSIQETENSLSILLSMPPQRIERGKLADQQFPEDLSIGVPLELLANRPDVRQAELRLEKSFYVTNAARSAFYPNLTLSGSAGWTNQGGAVITNPGNWLLGAIGSLVQPLFNKGQNYASLKVAEAEQKAATLSFQQSLLEAGKEVNDALSLWQTACQKKNLDEEKISHLEEAVRKTSLLMKYSSTNYLEVLVAEQSLLNAQMQQAQNQYEEIYGVISLYHALGGGIR